MIKKKFVYVYRLSVDTGFAPCVEDDLLTLACCKGGQLRKGKPCYTGLRYWIGSKKHCDFEKDDVYVLGTYKDKFLYFAKIDEVMEMTEYFSSTTKRTDMIYRVENGELVRNKMWREEKVHIDKEQNERDKAGKYVLLSRNYIYLGKDAVETETVSKYNAKGQETLIYDGETARGIIRNCLKLSNNEEHDPNNPLKKKCGGKKGGCSQ